MQIGVLHVIDAHQDLGEELRLDRLAELAVIGPKVAARVDTVGGDLMVFVKGELGPGHQITPAVVGKHGFGPLRHPAHRTAQRPRGLGHAEILRVGHRLHAEPTAHIGIGHAHRVFGQAEGFGQKPLMRPDALPAQRHMQAALGPFGIAATRLHGVDDDAVVTNLEPDAMGGFGKSRLNLGLIAHMPVKGAVVGGLCVQRLTARGDIHLGGQIVGLEKDHLNRVAGLLQTLGHHQRHRLAHIAHAVLGQHRAQRRRAFAAIAVVDDRMRQGDIHSRRFQIGAGQH